MRALLDRQQRAFDKLRQFRVGALFMEPGTGKTLTAYELIRSAAECDYILYLAPYRTIHSDKPEHSVVHEIKKCGGFSVPHRFVGIESLSNSDRIMLELHAELSAAKCPFVVVDESIKIKNHSAVRTKRIIELGKLAQYKLILNGTPISRNMVDLWAQFEFLSNRILNMTETQYVNTFCEFTRVTKRIGNVTRSREWISKYHNVEYLYSLIKHYVYECDLEIEAKRQYIDIPYTVSSDEREEYEYLKAKYLDDENMAWMRNNIFLEMTQKMQHSYSLAEAKFEKLEQVLNSHDRTKVLVYTKYLAPQDEIRARYPDLTVVTYGKNTFGLNMQEYNVTVFWDKTWDYMQRLQAERRTYREGQEHTCYYYNLTGNVGLEDMIDQNVTKKGNLLTYFKSFSAQELKKLL